MRVVLVGWCWSGGPGRQIGWRAAASYGDRMTNAWTRGRSIARTLAGERGRQLYRQIRSEPAPPAEPPRVVYVNHPSANKPRVLGMQFPPPGYLGQLADQFQARMAVERDFIEVDDCYFYHASTLADGAEIPGPWDLRGHESEYLGGVDVRGKRVLELGPASGHMSFHMEQAGADVVSLDVGFDIGNEIIPWDCDDLMGIRMSQNLELAALRNSWWYLHRDKRSKVKMVYGDIYDLPGDLGTFDVATFQSILLHLRSPFTALEQAARRTTGSIVVTEPIDPEIHHTDSMRFFPTRGRSFSTGWWSFSPATIEAMLDTLGFRNLRRTEHTQTHYQMHDMATEPVQLGMFTVVGSK